MSDDLSTWLLAQGWTRRNKALACSLGWWQISFLGCGCSVHLGPHLLP